jgi:hypothetical protein
MRGEKDMVKIKAKGSSQKLKAKGIMQIVSRYAFCINLNLLSALGL